MEREKTCSQPRRDAGLRYHILERAGGGRVEGRGGDRAGTCPRGPLLWGCRIPCPGRGARRRGSHSRSAAPHRGDHMIQNMGTACAQTKLFSSHVAQMGASKLCEENHGRIRPTKNLCSPPFPPSHPSPAFSPRRPPPSCRPPSKCCISCRMRAALPG